MGCVGTMTTTYGLIRGHKYRAELTAERLDVQTKANDNNASNDGIILWGPRGLCSGPNNRCLPIHYVTRNSLPFAPQNYGFIPTGAAIELQVVRANLQSVGGAPDPSIPTTVETRPFKHTGDLYMTAQSPFVISESRQVSCVGQENRRALYLLVCP